VVPSSWLASRAGRRFPPARRGRGRAGDCLRVRLSSNGCRSPASPCRRHSGRASRQRTPWWARDTSPGLGTWPPPISPPSAMGWWGARHGRVVTTAGPRPVRPATRGMRGVSRASARVISGRTSSGGGPASISPPRAAPGAGRWGYNAGIAFGFSIARTDNDSSASSTLASRRSAVSKPSVNQP
jgi:hypothetical protein